jgi:anaerobic magnesium-protoporphyrin IX monomethyl ester cyclase
MLDELLCSPFNDETSTKNGESITLNITLIRPPTLLPISSVTAHQGVPPLGLAYLGAFLRKNNHQVKYIDSLGEKLNFFSKTEYSNILANGLSTEEIIERIPKQTDIIGISTMFSNEWFFIDKLILTLKKNFPNAKIVLGGEHATADYEYILKNNLAVDIIIRGEGEVKLLNLCNELQNKEPLENIKGICYLDRVTNEVICDNEISRIKDIDLLFWPDWNGIPLESYLSKGLGMAAQGKRSYPTLASRGCPYQCTFCSSPQMWGTKWIARDVEDLICELKFAITNYQVSHVEFYDLTAIINANWIKNFCLKLIEENLNITWSLPSGTRSEALSKEVLILLKKSGCIKLTYAPESGSKKTLQIIKKKVNLQKMQTSIKHAVDAGLIIKINIVFGFPKQNFLDVFYTFLYLLKLALVGVHDVTCFSFSPYPGSELFNQLFEEGKIKKDGTYNKFLANNVYNSPLDMLSWSESIPHFMIPILTLGGMSFFYFFQFLMRPHRLISTIKSLINDKPVTMMDLAIHGLKRDFLQRRKLKIEN